MWCYKEIAKRINCDLSGDPEHNLISRAETVVTHGLKLSDLPTSHFSFEISSLTYTQGDLRPFPKSPHSIFTRNSKASSELQGICSIPKSSLLSV